MEKNMMRNRIDVAGYMNVEQMIIEINTSISVFRRTHKGAHRHTLVCTASRCCALLQHAFTSYFHTRTFTQMLLHTSQHTHTQAFTHISLHTCVYIQAFPHRLLHTCSIHMFLHRHSYTYWTLIRMRLYTSTLAHTRFYTNPFIPSCCMLHSHRLKTG